jgi:hypothetical protein
VQTRVQDARDAAASGILDALPAPVLRPRDDVVLQQLWASADRKTRTRNFLRSACLCRNRGGKRGGPPAASKRSPTPTSGTFPADAAPAPAPPVAGGKPLYLCAPFVDAALVKGNYKTIVMLPKYVDVMEWVAKNSELRAFVC